MTDEEQFEALTKLGDYAASDLASAVHRDTKGNAAYVAVVARGPYAARLLRFLKQLEKEKEHAEPTAE